MLLRRPTYRKAALGKTYRNIPIHAQRRRLQIYTRRRSNRIPNTKAIPLDVTNTGLGGTSLGLELVAQATQQATNPQPKRPSWGRLGNQEGIFEESWGQLGGI